MAGVLVVAVVSVDEGLLEARVCANANADKLGCLDIRLVSRFASVEEAALLALEHPIGLSLLAPHPQQRGQ